MGKSFKELLQEKAQLKKYNPAPHHSYDPEKETRPILIDSNFGTMAQTVIDKNNNEIQPGLHNMDTVSDVEDSRIMASGLSFEQYKRQVNALCEKHACDPADLVIIAVNALYNMSFN